MRGLWLEDGRLRLRRDLPAPRPPAGEALVRVIRAGICNTDLELARGYYPYTGIPGHEFVGRVEAGPEALLGRRVVGEINAVCHRCRACAQGRGMHCQQRTVLGIVARDGAFADWLALPVENLHPVPDGVGDDAAAFTEPLAAALRIGEQVDLARAGRALVVGDGKLGLLVAQVLALRSGAVDVAGHHPARMEAMALDGVHALAAAPEPGAYDLVVECSGQPAGFATARGALRAGGTLVLKSTYAGALTLDASSLVVDEITLVGSRCGPFEPALRLLADGRVAVAPMIHDRFALEDGEAAFRRAAEPGVLKVFLDVEGRRPPQWRSMTVR